MAPTPIAIPAELVELLDDAALGLHELARACAQSPEWVLEHVEAGELAFAHDAEVRPRIVQDLFGHDGKPRTAHQKGGVAA